MDFKVAGTKGITAIQMDLKNGLTMEIIRTLWTSPMTPAVRSWTRSCCPASPSLGRKSPEVRSQDGHYAHQSRQHRDVIGKGGSVIQKIVADTGAKIDIDDDGIIHIAAADAYACDAARKCIDDIVFCPEIGNCTTAAWCA